MLTALSTTRPVLSPEPVPSQATATNNQTSAEQAAETATDFLLEHVGNQLIAGHPLPLVSALHTLWIVPIHLSYIHTGIVGSVGVIAVDDETGRVIAWTPLAEIKAASRRLRENLEPELSQQFQRSSIATQTVSAAT